MQRPSTTGLLPALGVAPAEARRCQPISPATRVPPRRTHPRAAAGNPGGGSRCWGLWVIVMMLLARPGLSAEIERGVSIAAFGPRTFQSSAADRSLADVRALGASAVAINVSWWQDDETSTEIRADEAKSAALESVGHAIDEAHRLGMRVMLKPMVDVKSRIWRGTIRPRDAEPWFGSYGAFIGTFADLAKRKKVEIFCLGTEMNTLEGPEHEAQWRNLIRDVRRRYPGKLTYAANWHEGAGTRGGFRAVRFWDALDLVGINPYFAIADSPDPTAEQLAAGCRGWMDTLEAWRSEAGIDKPILYTEIGYPSFDGGAMKPWGSEESGLDPDPAEQAAAYEAFLSTVGEREWCAGCFLWRWEPYPHAGLRYPTGHTPQDKPAEKVIARHWGGTAPVPAAVRESLE